MINLKSSSTMLSKFPFNFTSFSWSSSATRSSTTVFPSMKSKQLAPRLLHPFETRKIIDEGQVVKYCMRDSALFPGSPFLLSPSSSWPQYKMAYKSLVNNEEKVGISEFMGYATTEQKMSTAFNKTSKIYEGVVTAGRFTPFPYSPVIVLLRAGNLHLDASHGCISGDVQNLKATALVYKMPSRPIDNDVSEVRLSKLRENAAEEGKMYCWRMFINSDDDEEVENEGVDPENGQQVNNEDVGPEHDEEADIEAVDPEDDNMGSAHSAAPATYLDGDDNYDSERTITETILEDHNHNREKGNNDDDSNDDFERTVTETILEDHNGEYFITIDVDGPEEEYERDIDDTASSAYRYRGNLKD